MLLLRCLVVSLLAIPALVYATVPDSNTPSVEGSPAVPAVEAPSAALATEEAQTQQALLKQRATARWDALIRKDFKAAYAFNSPSYRELYSLDSFRSRFGQKVAWRRIEVVDAVLKGEDAATVGLYLYFGYSHPQAEKTFEMKTYIQETWVRVDGQWWYLLKD